ncbi:transposase family protein [Acetobacterium tundrae]|uniref:Transposase IS204/IS1001/IS1096/IS1165 zinc-finger domain-containing protein n=1 Tax=Acetobacterium tundrae TaxID=132932 RepID=A0ABR6WR61_9FIRM|nr:hypothetical protein [Acetobacterium tundrae]
MDDLIKLLNENLEYEKHEIIEDILYIYVHSLRTTVKCPFCGSSTSRCHSRYLKNFQDLPIQGKKTIMYGRCGFQMLRYKIFFNSKSTNV